MLIQRMVITLKGGRGGLVNRVMVCFCKFKLCECKRQKIICKYIISNIKIIAYKLKEQGRENANTRFYSGLTQPDLYPLSSSFNPKLKVPLIQGFRTKPSSNTIGLWFQFTLLDFWLQAPFTLFKRYPTFEQPLK